MRTFPFINTGRAHYRHCGTELKVWRLALLAIGFAAVCAGCVVSPSQQAAVYRLDRCVAGSFAQAGQSASPYLAQVAAGYRGAVVACCECLENEKCTGFRAASCAATLSDATPSVPLYADPSCAQTRCARECGMLLEERYRYDAPATHEEPASPPAASAPRE